VTAVYPTRAEWVVEEVLDVEDPGPSPLAVGETGGFQRLTPAGWTPAGWLAVGGLSRME
jgi:hypothetical protein